MPGSLSDAKMQEERIWPRPAVFLHFLEFKKTPNIYIILKERGSPRLIYLRGVSQRDGGVGIKFLATLSPPTQQIYIFISYLYYCSPRKKKKFLAESFAFSRRRQPVQEYTWCKAPLKYSSHQRSCIQKQRLSSEKEPTSS